MYNTFSYLTPEQVAQILQLDVMTIYRYIRKKKLPAIKIGRAYRIDKRALETFLDSHKIAA